MVPEEAKIGPHNSRNPQSPQKGITMKFIMFSHSMDALATQILYIPQKLNGRAMYIMQLS